MKRINITGPDCQTYGNISGLRKKLEYIESLSGHSMQTLQLRNEITRLEALSAYSSVRKNHAYATFSRKNYSVKQSQHPQSVLQGFSFRLSQLCCQAPALV